VVSCRMCYAARQCDAVLCVIGLSFVGSRVPCYASVGQGKGSLHT
jgi:hypothetical protein